MATRDLRREENQKLVRRGNESLHDAAVATGYETEPMPFLSTCADGTASAELGHSQWEIRRQRAQHYLMIAGHAGSGAEEGAGSIREYEIAWKPG